MSLAFDAIEALEMAESVLGQYGDVDVAVQRSSRYMVEVRIRVITRRGGDLPYPKAFSSAYYADVRVDSPIPPFKFRFETMLASLQQHIEGNSWVTIG